MTAVRYTPPFDWFIDNGRFREARAYAAGAGQYVPGAMKTRIAQLDIGITKHPAIARWPEEDRACGRDMMRPQSTASVTPKKLPTQMPRSLAEIKEALPKTPEEAKQQFEQAKQTAIQAVREFVGPLDRSMPLPPFQWPNHGTSTAYVILGDDKVSQPSGAPAPGGVLPDARLIPYRISSSVISRRGKNLLGAIEDAISKNCKVVTISHLVAFQGRYVDDAITKAYEAGVIVCVAAGSHILPLRRSLSRLATSPMAIGVGASLYDDRPWRLTHGSPALDVLAPGYQVLTTRTSRNLFTGSEKYDFVLSEGTSFSAPLTAAAAALWCEHHGADLDRYSKPWMRVEAFKYCLQHSARPVQGITEAQRPLFGAGVLDALELLKIELPPERILRKSKVRPDHKRDRETMYVIAGELGQVIGTSFPGGTS